ncbi:hypothetical protein ATY41_06725 [Leifsonia xyli subsp. xyli]|uniref:4-hydroxybenzoate polyprenyltransferase n=2 Tax=Leifsonia xyli subsp. xyli TaxID=59736 RepID=Q6AFX8_LEIXX|nr:hypothetical protein [Leifsonia xyli]AAT88717.1 hypothetical protein Lxx08090 [Leifsonia xyli subsp. xyli str. CTCB07]ODA91081.1 hypothetical protein ATY41_06725 [Leifsonia xyli subsp. xyli]
MSHLTTVLAAAEAHIELPMPAWAYGAIAAVIFAALLIVTLSYRDVANRHSHRSDPDAAAHAGAPGAAHHGSGHPTQGH